MDGMVTAVSLRGVMVSTVSWNIRDVGSILALIALFPIVITPTRLLTIIEDFHQTHGLLGQWKELRLSATQCGSCPVRKGLPSMTPQPGGNASDSSHGSQLTGQYAL